MSFWGSPPSRTSINTGPMRSKADFLGQLYSILGDFYTKTARGND